MKTPLIFKLLLMLALGFRLMKSAKKEQSVPTFDKYLDLKAFESQPLLIDFSEELSAVELLKKTYREKVRAVSFDTRTLQMQMIYVADNFIRAFAKKGVFRFLWHRNELVFAFYQSLKITNQNDLALSFLELNREFTNVDLETFEPKNSQEQELFPNASLESQNLDRFNKIFDPETYSLAILSYVQQTS